MAFTPQHLRLTDLQCCQSHFGLPSLQVTRNSATLKGNVRLTALQRRKANRFMPRVTLKDVAARAGVSYQTVSKVLNNTANVTPDTDARIRQAIGELGYQPNISARNLRRRVSNLFGYAWRRTPDGEPHPVL